MPESKVVTLRRNGGPISALGGKTQNGGQHRFPGLLAPQRDRSILRTSAEEFAGGFQEEPADFVTFEAWQQ
jgi:hypothetical protein